MSEKKCTFCGNLFLGEVPGVFYDFDADPRHGSDGMPLCPECLGTGVIPINNSEFQTLANTVRSIRAKRFSVQIAACEGRLSPGQLRQELFELDKQLKDIARKALGIIKEPAKGCYAKAIF